MKAARVVAVVRVAAKAVIVVKVATRRRNVLKRVKPIGATVPDFVMPAKAAAVKVMEVRKVTKVTETRVTAAAKRARMKKV